MSKANTLKWDSEKEIKPAMKTDKSEYRLGEPIVIQGKGYLNSAVE
jgi:hypothetical protein